MTSFGIEAPTDERRYKKSVFQNLSSGSHGESPGGPVHFRRLKVRYIPDGVFLTWKYVHANRCYSRRSLPLVSPIMLSSATLIPRHEITAAITETGGPPLKQSWQ